MDVRFINPVVFVRDIVISKKFYCEVLGLKPVQDFSTIVIFENHFAIHSARELLITVYGQDPGESEEPLGRENLLLYFECADLDEAFAAIGGRVELIHPILRQAWGQRVFRFHDPDHHIVEIGEPL
jgi:catechol 2,3-dioxygenase-like lactoylglutathione lyase family enzyme